MKLELADPKGTGNFIDHEKPLIPVEDEIKSIRSQLLHPHDE